MAREKEVMGEPNMFMENVVNSTCSTTFKIPAYREEKFKEMTT